MLMFISFPAIANGWVGFAGSIKIVRILVNDSEKNVLFGFLALQPFGSTWY